METIGESIIFIASFTVDDEDITLTISEHAVVTTQRGETVVQRACPNMMTAYAIVAEAIKRLGRIACR